MRKSTCLALLLFLSAVAFSQESETVKPTPLPEGNVYLKGNYQFYRRLAKVAPELQGSGMENLANEFRSGGVLSFEGGVRVAKHQYIGLTHSSYTNTGSFPVTRQFQTQSVGTLTGFDNAQLKERISYTGLNYMYLLPLSAAQRAFFTTRGGVGLWGYNGSVTAFSMTEEMKKAGLGYQIGAGLEVRLAKNISWTVDLDLLTGGIEVEEGERENLSQLRGGTGVMLRF